ncbi:prolyl-tRNA synthetase associated domain-containing protein [Methylobacterium sp. NEAU 140]|uniref:prolyl-tRNA synthetase associated domain-containing protein n=1 Tax=Methylobacterium sp. NEAU 140 TaxID=3064945 RepID=UPI0027337F74|nr:prolyl-tRNA synthetase associated domain-containing protein [Methylobacterium sp. NEAU 140]MDP4025375.1 prolyl-tRNA synthetase associated domain-containing protein [Methylobacterium sp. NEAU 140]
MPLTPDDLLSRLRDRDIAYTLHEHPPVLTVEAMMAACGDIAGAHTKNLFLRDGKKTYFLVTLRHDAQVDLRAFRSVLGARGGLSFASAEALREQLGVESGAVSPLAALNAAPGSVKVFIQDRLLSEPLINVHPLVSTRTLSVVPDDLLNLLRADGHSVEAFALPDADRSGSDTTTV